ncbi:MAG: hypothetical protein ACREUJ_06230 [Burkholderiales bacterium]
MCFTIEQGERADLFFLENMLLWSTHAWVVGLRRRIPVEERIEEVFTKISAADAAGQMYGFMWTLGHCASRTIEIGCVCNPKITADERCLIAILALVQHGRSAEALIVLRSLFTANAAVAAIDSAQRLMTCLTAAGRILSPRRPSITDVRCVSGGAVPDDCRTVILH